MPVDYLDADVSKRDTLNYLLEFGRVFLFFDTVDEGVVVPEQYANTGLFRIDLGDASGPEAVEVGEYVVNATLLIQGQRQRYTVPYGALFAVGAPVGTPEGGTAYVWRQDLLRVLRRKRLSSVELPLDVEIAPEEEPIPAPREVVANNAAVLVE